MAVKQSDSTSWTYFHLFEPTAPPVVHSNSSLFFRMNAGFACGAHLRVTARTAINQRHMSVGRGEYGVDPGAPCSEGWEPKCLICMEKKQGVKLSDEFDPQVVIGSG
jgi:hypothetical protein